MCVCVCVFQNVTDSVNLGMAACSTSPRAPPPPVPAYQRAPCMTHAGRTEDAKRLVEGTHTHTHTYAHTGMHSHRQTDKQTDR